MDQSSSLQEAIIQAAIEKFPIFADEGPIVLGKPRVVFIKEVITEVEGSMARKASSDFIKGYLECIVRSIQLLGLLDQVEYDNDTLQAISHDSYLSILCHLDLMIQSKRSQDFGSSGTSTGPLAIRRFLENVETMRIQQYGKRATPLRQVTKAVTITLGWSEEIQRDVFLFYKKHEASLGREKRIEWRLPGGYIKLDAAPQILSRIDRHQSRLKPNPKTALKGAIIKIAEELGVDEDRFVIRKIDLPEVPLVQIGRSYSRIVLTERKYWPFSLNFGTAPTFSDEIRKKVRWFTMDTIKSGSDTDGIPIGNEIFLSINQKLPLIKKNLLTQNSEKIPIIPLEAVEGSIVEMANIRVRRIDDRKIHISLTPLGINHALTCSARDDLIIFSSGSAPTLMNIEKLTETKLGEMKHGFDILMNDTTQQITSRRSQDEELRIDMRTGNTLRYQSLRFVLLNIGNTLRVEDWHQFVFCKLTGHYEFDIELDTKKMLRVANVLRQKLLQYLEKGKVTKFIETGLTTRATTIGKTLKTCLIIQPQTLQDILE